MDKYIVEKNIPKAVETIKKYSDNNKVEKTMRSKMSSFGAMVIMSGLLPAVAYFQKNEPTIIQYLNDMCYDKVDNVNQKQMCNDNSKDGLAFYNYIVEEIKEDGMEQITENILNYCVSLKLALNLFELI